MPGPGRQSRPAGGVDDSTSTRMASSQQVIALAHGSAGDETHGPDAVAGCWLTCCRSAAPALAPTPPPAPAPAAEKITEQKEEAKPKTLWDEFKLFSYVEMGATFNLNGGSKGVPGATSSYERAALLRLRRGLHVQHGGVQHQEGPDGEVPVRVGLVLTAGLDAQKNHSIGILRDDDDAFPFRNTPWFDLQEAYISGRIPIGNGPVLKVGKFVTLLGYEVIESPNNLNYSRGYLFSLAIPLTHTGGLVSYSFTDWLSVQAGLVLGWDRSNTDNDGPSGTGQIASTPIKDLHRAELHRGAGDLRRQEPHPLGGRPHRELHGPQQLTFGFNFDYGSQANDVFLSSQVLGDKSASWYGIAAYAAYDFLKDFRVALRQEWFNDVDGVRTGTVGGVTLFSTTATLQYNIWKGLFARGEYRHDNANEAVFGCRPATGCREEVTGHALGQPLLQVLLTVPAKRSARTSSARGPWRPARAEKA